uniref:Uncharacterized protein n=1 Tax=Abalone asfa-like virus TaxID=2839893 RepID=A0A5K7Y7Z1_9VIRU|nr:hypothetical protein [Abalone asfa-like virus]
MSSSTDTTIKKKRKQLAGVLQMCISPARVQSHLKPQMLDSKSYNQHQLLKNKLKDSSEEEKVQIRKEMSELVENRIRTSSTTPIVMSVGIEHALEQCLKESLFDVAFHLLDKNNLCPKTPLRLICQFFKILIFHKKNGIRCFDILL